MQSKQFLFEHFLIFSSEQLTLHINLLHSTHLAKLKSTTKLHIGHLYFGFTKIKLFKQKFSFVSSKLEQLENRIYTLEAEPRLNLEPLTERVSSIEGLGLADKINTVETRMSNVEQLSNTITDVSYRLSEVERKPDLGERLYAIELALATMVVKPSSPSSV